MARRRRRGRRAGDASRAIVLLLIAALLYGAWLVWQGQGGRPGSTPTTQTTGRAIRIATWNLRKFSETGRPNLVVIAEVIKSSGFDLIAIQEVQQQGQEVLKLRRQLGEPWRASISEPAGSRERFAFVYRSDILDLLSQPVLVDSVETAGFARKPFTASFRAWQFDFTLLTVHLWYGEAGYSERRSQESAALANLAQRIVAGSGEKDLIVLGDFNEFGRAGNLHYLEGRGFGRLIHEPTNLSSTEIYDNLVIDAKHTREWAGTAGVVRFDEARYGNDDKRASDEVSDHRPAYADFRTDRPDDD